MRIAYFDCFTGASGDMILGSLLDSGLDFEKFKEEVSKINLSGYDINIQKIAPKGISGTKLNIDIVEHHHHRGLGRWNRSSPGSAGIYRIRGHAVWFLHTRHDTVRKNPFGSEPSAL